MDSHQLKAANQTNNPYSFIKDDWDTELWFAVINAAWPAATYYWLNSSNSASTDSGMIKKLATFKQVAEVHAAVWAPLLLIGFFTSFGVLKPFAAFWLEHISSNANPLTYLWGFFMFSELALTTQDNWGWWYWYLITGVLFHFVEKRRGTFAMYWLNPKLDTLDAKLHPSIMYALGWRQHRYRYYHYYPEFAPNFDV